MTDDRERLAEVRAALIEAVSARLHVTTDRITGLTHGIALSADTAAVEEAVDAVLASNALAGMLAEARSEALREAADAGPSSTATDQLWQMFLRDRAALTAEDAP